MPFWFFFRQIHSYVWKAWCLAPDSGWFTNQLDRIQNKRTSWSDSTIISGWAWGFHTSKYGDTSDYHNQPFLMGIQSWGHKTKRWHFGRAWCWIVKLGSLPWGSWFTSRWICLPWVSKPLQSKCPWPHPIRKPSSSGHGDAVGSIGIPCEGNKRGEPVFVLTFKTMFL